MVIGSGARLMVGLGLGMSRGVGHPITSDVGFITTTRGRGCREASTTRDAVGGGLRWSLLCRWISRLGMTSAGIRCRITSAIRIHVITVITIVRHQIMVVVTLGVLAGRMVGAMVIRREAVLAGNPVLVLVSLVAGLITPELICPVPGLLLVLVPGPGGEPVVVRRSEIFRGREPRRPSEPVTRGPQTTPAQINSPSNTSAPNTSGQQPSARPSQVEVPPSGAVARPEPRSDEGRGRVVRPGSSDGA